jgi:hypothetical protein
VGQHIVEKEMSCDPEAFTNSGTYNRDNDVTIATPIKRDVTSPGPAAGHAAGPAAVARQQPEAETKEAVEEVVAAAVVVGASAVARGWSCDACTFANDPNAAQCVVCSAAAPSTARTGTRTTPFHVPSSSENGGAAVARTVSSMERESVAATVALFATMDGATDRQVKAALFTAAAQVLGDILVLDKATAIALGGAKRAELIEAGREWPNTEFGGLLAAMVEAVGKSL